MDFKEIRELIEMINSSELAYFELKMGDNYIKMDKSLTRSTQEKSSRSNELNVEEIKEKVYKENTENSFKSEDTIVEESKENEDLDITTITCPMVGTFYASPAPGQDSFVKEGMKVSKGNILCIVEAMKLMNEIECEYDCEIYKILVKDGDMVEYGQPLFSVRRV